jgi:hypothetical protein
MNLCARCICLLGRLAFYDDSVQNYIIGLCLLKGGEKEIKLLFQIYL